MTIINSVDIKKHFGCEVHAADKDYLCPSLTWVRRDLLPKYREFKRKYKLDKYEPEIQDCDDAAVYLYAFARALHSRTSKNRDVTIALGEIWYKTRNGGFHSIDSVFIGKDAVLKFIEPQTPAIVDLTPAERKSIWFVRF